MSPLEVDVLHNEITVTVPGTNYMATYYKPRDFSDTYCKAHVERRRPADEHDAV